MPGLDPRLRAMMLEDIAKRLTPTAIRMRADIEARGEMARDGEIDRHPHVRQYDGVTELSSDRFIN